MEAKVIETKDTVNKDEISLQSAVKVSGRVELKTVKLLECSCKKIANCPTGNQAFNTEKNSTFQIGKEQNLIEVFIKFALKAFSEGAEQKKENAYLEIEATFLLLYHIQNIEGLDDNAFRSFAEFNGTYNAWPYWREFVQSITSRMQLPPLTIPVFRIVSPPPKKTAENEIVTADKK